MLFPEAPMNSIPVDPLDFELLKLAYIAQKNAEGDLQKTYAVVQQQLGRMAVTAGISLAEYTFSLDTQRFEPIPPQPKPAPEPEPAPEPDPALEAAREFVKVVPFPTN